MQQEITRELVQSWLPRRQADSNKGSYGSVLAAAGSLAYRGAAALCAEGALRGGAGLVYLASVEPVVQMVLARTPECCACGWGHPPPGRRRTAQLVCRKTRRSAGRAGLGGAGRGSLPRPAGQESAVGGCGAGRRRTERACGGQAAGPLAGKYHPDAPPRRGRATAGLHRGRCTSRPGAGRFAAGRNLSLRRRSKGQRHVDCRAGRGAFA